MNRKYSWLPIDEQLIPNIFSFTYPKSTWVRVMLAIEIICAIIAVVTTLILVILPQTVANPPSTQATSPATKTQNY